MTTIFQLHGGPWDGQTLSTSAENEANACFAQAMLALTGGRIGSRIPLVSPACQQRIDAGVSPEERAAIRPHNYEIVDVQRDDGVVRLRAELRLN